MGEVFSDLNLIELKQFRLRKALATWDDPESSIPSFLLQWEDLKEHLDSTRKSIEAQFKELEEHKKEMGLKEKQLGSVQSELGKKETELFVLLQEIQATFSMQKSVGHDLDLKIKKLLSRLRSEASVHNSPLHSLPIIQGAVDSSLPLTEGVTESSSPLIQGSTKSPLLTSHSAMTEGNKQEQKKFIEEGPSHSSLFSDEKSTLPPTQGPTELSLPMTRGKVTKRLKEISGEKEWGENEEETNIEIETTLETNGTELGQRESINEGPSHSYFSEETSSSHMARVDSTCSSPLTQETEESGDSEEETDADIEATSESSLPLAQGALDASLPQDTVESSLPMTMSQTPNIGGEAISQGNQGPPLPPKASNSQNYKNDTNPWLTRPSTIQFSFADFIDLLLMIFGTIGAIGNGLGLPIMTRLFGELINVFGNKDVDIVSEVSKVCVKFVYMAVAIGVAEFLQVAGWTLTGERQAARMRGLYLKAILRQDVAFFGNEANTEEVVRRMSCDTVLLQDAIFDKVGKFIQLIVTVIGGFVIAFLNGWVLTLVLLPIPFLVEFAVFIPIIISKTACGKNAPADVVEETIGSIKMVASTSGEKQAIIKYKEVLEHAYKSSVHEVLVSRLGFAVVMLVMFSSYSLAVWRGSKLILHNGYGGGDVLNVVMAVLAGSMSLGQVSPCISAFVTCKASRMSFLQSLSRASSFSISAFGWPLEVNIPDDGLTEVEENIPKDLIIRVGYNSMLEIHVLLLGTIVAAINGAIFPIFGLLLGRVISLFYEPHHKLRKDSIFWSLMFVALGVVSFLAILARGYLFAVVECKLMARIKLMCFKKLVHMEVSWFDDPAHSSGTIGARLSADAATAGALFGDTLGQMVHVITSIVVGLVIAFLASWELALIIILGLILVIGFNGYIQLMYKEASQVVKPREAGIRKSLITGINFGTSFGLLFLVYAASFYVGAKLVKFKKATFSNVFQVFFALTMTAMGVSRASTLSTDIGKAMKAFGSLFEIVVQKSKIDSSDNEFGMKFNYPKGHIELCRVYFACPYGPNTPIFQNLSLLVRPGESVAIVGERGNGVSMLLALLQRIYDPDAGRIIFDGFDITEYNINWLRHQMILLTGEPVLFNQSIFANIACGKEGSHATLDEVHRAALLADAQFIFDLPKGFDTVVGDCGVQLSREQKQLLAIARAFIRSPKILLVDEDTSALDIVYESVVEDALVRVMLNRTTVIVAHGLSTIKNSDAVAVIKNGVIVEKGKHDTLIENKDGFYASLVGALHTTASSTA